MIEQVQKLVGGGTQVILAVPNTGEVERLADMFTEYNASYRLGSRTRSGESYADETSYFAGDVLTTTLLKAYLPDGFVLPEAHFAIFGARDLFDESDLVAARPQRQKSKVSAFLSDFRDLQVGDYVVHVEHGIGQYQGLKEINQGDGAAEFMLLEYADAARLYVPLTRLDLVQKYRSSEGAKPVLNHLGTQAWGKTKARVRKAMKDMTDELLKLYAQRQSARGHIFPAGYRVDEGVRRFVRIQRDGRPGAGHRRREARHGIAAPHGSSAVRRRRLRQDRSRDARRLQGPERQQASRRARAHHGSRVSALRNFQATIRAVPAHRRNDQPLPHAEAGQRNFAKSGSRQSRHPDRHPPPALKGREVRRPRPAGGGRGTALRRPPQRTHQADAHRSRRAHHVSDADSAHAAHVAGRPARHERDRNAAQRSHGDSDRGRELGRKADSVGDRTGT